MDWSKLPPELFSIICEYLEEDDLVSLSGACSAWLHYLNGLVLKKDSSFISRPPILIPSESKETRKLLVVNFRSDHFKSLSSTLRESVDDLSVVFDKGYVPDESWIDSLLLIIHDGIKCLKFKNIILEEVQAAKLLSGLPLSIESFTSDLSLDGCEHASVFEEAREIFSCLSLKKFDCVKCYFSGLEVNSVEPISGSIQRVEISCLGLKENHYNRLFNLKQSISHLRLSDSFNLSVKSLKIISKLDLITLEISNAQSVTDDEWSTVFDKGFDSLKALSITKCKGLSDAALGSIFAKPGLESLEIETLNSLDFRETLRSISISGLSELVIHVEMTFLGPLTSWIRRNCPSDTLELIIYGPYNAENYSNHENMLKRISNICQSNNTTFKYDLNFTKTTYSFVLNHNQSIH